MLKDYTGIILAGGTSRRMGRDKSLLKFNGRTLIENAISIMDPVFPEVIIIANETEKYQQFGKKIFGDIYKGVGPLAGIHSGLTNSTTENNFIIAADMPCLPTELVNEICAYPTNKSVTVVSINNKIEGLAGKYSRIVLPHIEKILSENLNEIIPDQKINKNSLSKFIRDADSCIIDIAKLRSAELNHFLNINTYEDYLNIQPD